MSNIIVWLDKQINRSHANRANSLGPYARDIRLEERLSTLEEVKKQILKNRREEVNE